MIFSKQGEACVSGGLVVRRHQRCLGVIDSLVNNGILRVD